MSRATVRHKVFDDVCSTTSARQAKASSASRRDDRGSGRVTAVPKLPHRPNRPTQRRSHSRRSRPTMDADDEHRRPDSPPMIYLDEQGRYLDGQGRPDPPDADDETATLLGFL